MARMAIGNARWWTGINFLKTSVGSVCAYFTVFRRALTDVITGTIWHSSARLKVSYEYCTNYSSSS